jgi:hypothetical protein
MSSVTASRSSWFTLVSNVRMRCGTNGAIIHTLMARPRPPIQRPGVFALCV